MASIIAESLQNPTDANPYMHMIVKAIHKKDFFTLCGIRASEIVKGGSLGQGTAVPNEFDLDLIIYSRDIDPSIMLNRSALQKYLQNIDEYLSRQLPRRYKSSGTTNHAVRCVLDGELEVDILLSPYWSTPNDYHSFLKKLSNNYKRRMFSCSAAKWQMKFFQNQPDNVVKEYIKSAKTWRNNKWPKKKDGIGRPKSFLICLLVVHAYDRSSSGKAQSVTDIMKNSVRKHSRLHVHFEDALYSPNYKCRFPPRPYIIDPANPFNNVYLSGISKYKANSPEGTYEPGDGNWTKFVQHIHSLDLSKMDGTRC